MDPNPAVDESLSRGQGSLRGHQPDSRLNGVRHTSEKRSVVWNNRADLHGLEKGWAGPFAHTIAPMTISTRIAPGSVQTQVTGLHDRGVMVGFWSDMNNANLVNDNFGFYRLGGDRFHSVTFPTDSNATPQMDQLLGVNNRDLAVAGDGRRRVELSCSADTQGL